MEAMDAETDELLDTNLSKRDHRTWYIAFAVGLIALFGCVAAGFTISHPRDLEDLQAIEQLSGTKTPCSSVTCDEFSRKGLRSPHFCDGDDPTTAECIGTCCSEEVRCNSLPQDFCSNQGPSFLNRIVTPLDRGLPGRTGTCRGEPSCTDNCCQRVCSDISCPKEEGKCQRPFPPKKCTDSTCEEQCCYDTQDYCGTGINAWTAACHECMHKTEWCEQELGVDRSSVSQDEWNRIVFKKVEEGQLIPGCEEDTSWRCADTPLKLFVMSTFVLHQTDEGVSANTVAILPGGTQALSGGDDGQVWVWRISDGMPLKNFTADTNPILQVSPFNDATYFCAVSKPQAIVWLLQLRDGLEIPGKTELPEDKRKGATPPNNTACVGINTWETAIVGQDNGFAVVWHWKQENTMTVPTDPQLPLIWQIETDAGYYHWPSWDKNDVLQNAFVAWRRHIFGLDVKYNRRLEANMSSESSQSSSKPDAETSSESSSGRLRRLKRSTGPWPNYFSNVRWGDVPKWYYKPGNWGKVVSVIQIPSNRFFVVGYEHGSIRIWKTYNGFIQALIPKAHVGKVNALVPAPAGDVFWSGGDDGWIREWEAGSGKPLHSHYAAFAGPVLSLSFVPGGNAFWSGHADKVFLFWLVAETEWPLCHVDAEGGKVKSLAVNPGKIGQVAVALENGLVKVYEQR